MERLQKDPGVIPSLSVEDMFVFCKLLKTILNNFHQCCLKCKGFVLGKFNLEPGSVVEGRLQKLKKLSGILVNLVGGTKGIVCLTDLSDEYQNEPLSDFRHGQHLKCYVINLGPKQTYQLSLRKSR